MQDAKYLNTIRFDAVKNQVITSVVAPEFSMAQRISEELTRLMSGSNVDDLNGLLAGILRDRFQKMGFDDRLVAPILNAIVTALSSADNVKIYTSGMKNILEFPEFADPAKAGAIVGTLEEKDEVLSLLSINSEQIRIVIGEENEKPMLRDCSVIKAKIRINEHSFGNIAIIGPTRMDYSQVMSVLTAVLKNFDFAHKNQYNR